MKHVNIPVFIPHLGCPNDCVFCNQKRISGTSSFDKNSVNVIIKNALSTVDSNNCETEIAFFGGSFTGIDRDDMLYLLQTAYKYVKHGEVASIRLSTRPDYISREILSVLSRYSVRVIELGLQSMNDEVLRLCKRGHTAAQAREAPDRRIYIEPNIFLKEVPTEATADAAAMSSSAVAVIYGRSSH